MGSMNSFVENFLEYLGIEEKNMLVNIVEFREEFESFNILDNIYRKPLNRFSEISDERSNVIMGLYYFVHISLYFAFSCLLRCHILECLSTTRKAIDAALSAYKIILEPSTYKNYLNRDNYFQCIKRNMQDENKKDSKKYPIAKPLFLFHDLCSRYGSHADKDSFEIIVSQKPIPEIKKLEKSFNYFQFFEKQEINRFFYQTILSMFFLNFEIFRKHFDLELKIIDPEWQKAIKAFKKTSNEQLKKYMHIIEGNKNQ